MSVPVPAQALQIPSLTAASARAQSGANPQAVQVTPSAGPATASQSGDHESVFEDLLDILNPLQHLPVVSTIYRAITGDKIGDVEQVAGDALYGGLIGLGSSIANLIFKDVTGKSVGNTVLAWAEDATGITIGNDAGNGTSQPTVVASNSPAAQPSTPQWTPVPALAGATTAQSRTAQAAPAAARPVTPTKTAPAAVTPAQATTLPALLTDPAAFMAAVKARGIDPALGMRAMEAYAKSLGLSSAQP